MVAPQATVPLIAGLASVMPSTDVILCDIWGVLHDGKTAHPQAWHALVQARAQGALVVLISNAPRPGTEVLQSLALMDIPGAVCDDIVTSGDLTRALLRDRPGVRVCHIGPALNQITFDGLDVTFTGPDHADLAVCTDLVNEDIETPEDYRPLLATILARKITLVCANPDIIVERGDKMVFCAGAIARLYDQMGGETIYCGKPHRMIYDTALARAQIRLDQQPDHNRVLCIGDALHTDMAGAAMAQLRSLFIAGGIHADELGVSDPNTAIEPRLLALFKNKPLPIAALKHLIW